MKLHVTKLFSAGHNYLFLPFGTVFDATACPLCDQKRGIGADGVILSAGDDAVIYCNPMGVFDTPPTEALLCAAKELYDTGVVNSTEFCVSDGRTSTRLRVENCGGEAWGITRDLGYPILDTASMSPQLSGLYRESMLPGILPCPVTLLSLGETYAFLHLACDEPLPDLKPLFSLLSDKVVPSRVNFAASDMLSVTALTSPCIEANLSAAAAVSATISGHAPFSKPLRVACQNTTYRVTVTPSLRLYVTTEVERIFRGDIELDCISFP